MRWTTPEDLRQQVMRLWDRGLVLQALLTEETGFPRRLVLKTPSARELTNDFMLARDWSHALSKMKFIRLVRQTIRHRVSGENELPHEAWIDTPFEAVELIGKQREWKAFQRMVETTRERRPILLEWLRQRPVAALGYGKEWVQFLDLMDWLEAHPRPDRYLRQVDVLGIDTKFIEGHRGVLSELIDVAFPLRKIESEATGVSGFNRRYGFRDKPERIRFRILDPERNILPFPLMSDISLDQESFCRLPVLPETLFITENETNFLAFPGVKDSWIIFGAGYGFSGLKAVKWMATCRILYWGDIDTHGFAILDELRSHFPKTESLLMDHETLKRFELMWGRESKPCERELRRLEREELSLYEDLRSNHYGQNLRLEQERVGYAWLLSELRKRGFELI